MRQAGGQLSGGGHLFRFHQLFFRLPQLLHHAVERGSQPAYFIISLGQPSSLAVSVCQAFGGSDETFHRGGYRPGNQPSDPGHGSQAGKGDSPQNNDDVQPQAVEVPG